MAASIKGSRCIPLASKEAKKLLSQSGLSLISDNCTKASENSQLNLPDVGHRVDLSDNQSQTSMALPQREVTGELYCQSCHVELGDREEQLVHYRLDWHRYNLKRRLKGLAPFTQEEFEKMAGDCPMYATVKDLNGSFIVLFPVHYY